MCVVMRQIGRMAVERGRRRVVRIREKVELGAAKVPMGWDFPPAPAEGEVWV